MLTNIQRKYIQSYRICFHFLFFICKVLSFISGVRIWANVSFTFELTWDAARESIVVSYFLERLLHINCCLAMPERLFISLEIKSRMCSVERAEKYHLEMVLELFWSLQSLEEETGSKGCLSWNRSKFKQCNSRISSVTLTMFSLLHCPHRHVITIACCLLDCCFPFFLLLPPSFFTSILPSVFFFLPVLGITSYQHINIA